MFEDLDLLPDDPPPDMIQALISRVRKFLSGPDAKDASRADLLRVNRIILKEVERLGARIVSDPAIKPFISVDNYHFTDLDPIKTYEVEADGVYFEYSDYQWFNNAAANRFQLNPFERLPFIAYFDDEPAGVPLYDSAPIYRKFRKIKIEYFHFAWPFQREYLHIYFLRGVKLPARNRQIWQDRVTEWNVREGAKLRDGRQLVETDVGRVVDVSGSAVAVSGTVAVSNDPIGIDPAPTDYTEDWDTKYTTVTGGMGNQNVISAVTFGRYIVSAITVWHASSQQFQFHWESSATIIWMLGVNSYTRCHTIIFPPPFLLGPAAKRLQVNCVQAGTGFVSVAYMPRF